MNKQSPRNSEHGLFLWSRILSGLLEITSKPPMGSLETPTTTETNGSATPAVTSNGGDHKPPVTANGVPLSSTDSRIVMAQESEATKKRRASMLPLEVGTRVMCRWRDGKYHPVKVIERRKMHFGGPNDYEYYVHYTECMFSLCSIKFSFNYGFLYFYFSN